MGILIILRSLNRAIYEKKLPLFYITEVERDNSDIMGEYYNIKSKIYNNEKFKWEDNVSTLLLSDMEQYTDNISSFLETWVSMLYDRLIQHMWIANRM